MAAQVEVQTGEVARTVTGGRIHLSPLTDSINKSLIEISPISESHINATEPDKPVPTPKPRLTPKPFAVEKNPTIKPILAPKPQTKPRPESTRLAGYKPDLPNTPKPTPRPVSTNPNRPAPTSFKTSNKLSTGQTTKPVVQPFKPAPSVDLADLNKPTRPVPAERQKPAASSLAYSKSLKSLSAAEWSGTTTKEDESKQNGQNTGRTPITRAKSMGFLAEVGQEEEKEKDKALSEVSVPLRPQPRSPRPRPVSAIFPSTPTKIESPVPVPRWTARRPLSADLTSKFESIGLSLHRKSPEANTKENTSTEKNLPLKREQDKSLSSATPQSSAGVTDPALPDTNNKKTDETTVKDAEEEKHVASIKSRISLLLDSSSSPVTNNTGQDLCSPVQPVAEKEPAVGVKKLIKQLTEDAVPTQSPVVKPVLKPRPLVLDLTKRFSSERSPDFVSVMEDLHEVSKDPQTGAEESTVTPTDQKIFLDLRNSPEQLRVVSTPESSEMGQSCASSKESGADGAVHTVRASLFENVVARQNVLMMDQGELANAAKDSLSSVFFKKADVEDEGTLVIATYKEPTPPSSPLQVFHAFDTLLAVEENKAVSESVPAAKWEDKAMTLRSRRSEGSRPTFERTELAQAQPASTLRSETQPRYLRIGALHKWNTAEFDPNAALDKEMLKESQREGQVALDKDRDKQRAADQDEMAAAPKRLKMLQGEEQPKPRATYFALTGQMQESGSPGNGRTSFGDMTALLDDFSVRSALGVSQGKNLPFRRNPSLEEAFGKTSQSHGKFDELILRSHTSPMEVRSQVDEETKVEITEAEKKREQKREAERHRAKIKEIEKQRQLELEKQRMKEWEMQREFERQRQKAFEKEKQEFEEKQRALERQEQIELEKQRLQELEKKRRKETEKERQRQLQKEKLHEPEKKREQEREKELEKERQRQKEEDQQRQLDKEKQIMEEMERIKEAERQQVLEFQKQKQKEKERQQIIELEKQRQREEAEKEAEKFRQMLLEQEILRMNELEKERVRQKELEIERRKEMEREKQREQEKQRRQDLEKERELEKERQRQKEEEQQRRLDKEKQIMEEIKRIKEAERQQVLEFQKQKQKEKERQQIIELEKQRQREKAEKEAENFRQMLIEQEMLRMKELEKERARQKELEVQHQKEMEREKQREQEKQKQRDLESEKQRLLDVERQQLENERLRREQERERQRKEDLEALKEMERRQLLEFEKQKHADREKQHFDLEKQRHKEKMEKEEAEKMRQIAKQQEAERQRLKEKQKKEEQERLRIESSALRPKVLDLDSVLRNDQLPKPSPRSDPATRWREPYKPAILDIDSFSSQTQPSPSKDLFPVSGIQGLDAEFVMRLQSTPERDVNWKVPSQTSVGFSSPVWTYSPQDPWEVRPVEMPLDKPVIEPKKPTNKLNPEELLFNQEERLPNPQRHCPAFLDEPRFSAPPAGAEPKTGNFLREPPASTSREQIWIPRELQPPQKSRGEAPSHRRSQGSQGSQDRMRSRSVSRRSAPSSSAEEASLSRMRSRSAHREQDRPSWVQQKQSGEEKGKGSETPVHETDSQYGTWETGLRSDDSLTPATPSSESNLSPSPRKPTSPHSPGDPASQLETDTLDGVPPLSSSESQPLPSFPDAPTALLDNSVLRSRAQLGKKRAPRTRPSKATRQSTAQAQEEGGTTDDWLYRDSTEAKAESKDDDSESEEKTRGADAGPAVASQPQRVALFPGVDPSALKAQLKKRGDSDNQTDGPVPSPSHPSRSPKSPFLPRAARVLPPPGGKENSEEASPQWLKELKSKKRLSQYESET